MRVPDEHRYGAVQLAAPLCTSVVPIAVLVMYSCASALVVALAPYWQYLPAVVQYEQTVLPVLDAMRPAGHERQAAVFVFGVAMYLPLAHAEQLVPLRAYPALQPCAHVLLALL